MCGYAPDTDGPELCKERMRRARKEHQCSECYRAIAPGERYLHIVGKWEGSWSEFRMCLRCTRLSEANQAAHHALNKDAVWVYGNVREEIRECLAQEPEYRRHFKAALREARAEIT